MTARAVDGKRATSRAAAARVLPSTGTLRFKVFEALVLLYPEGMTDEQMQEALEMKGSTQRPRRGELVEMGWVVESGELRSTHGKNDAIVWKYVP